ncbi:MAG TPA: DUF4006 family protein [Campylobacterales bacterium]|jgi:hypothetical protein|nr:DUF4006 family protein [Campylobacterales bacterium]HHD80660.1 DUF4006 family protein [Campylobacterales bacterium]HHH51974.1 DUF4006 family protein [Campylobacterales bacterium]
MAGNTQIDPQTEGGLFSFMHGLKGYAVFLVLFLTGVVILTVNAVSIQQDNATNYYKINQDLSGLTKNSPKNHDMRTIVGDK